MGVGVGVGMGGGKERNQIVRICEVIEFYIERAV